MTAGRPNERDERKWGKWKSEMERCASKTIWTGREKRRAICVVGWSGKGGGEDGREDNEGIKKRGGRGSGRAEQQQQQHSYVIKSANYFHHTSVSNSYSIPFLLIWTTAYKNMQGQVRKEIVSYQTWLLIVIPGVLSLCFWWLLYKVLWGCTSSSFLPEKCASSRLCSARADLVKYCSFRLYLNIENLSYWYLYKSIVVQCLLESHIVFTYNRPTI